MGKNKMIAKSCPKCEMQVAVALKACKCGHSFFPPRKTVEILPVAEDIRRRTGRVRRSQPQFYDAQLYQKQKKKSNKKRSLSQSIDDTYKVKESGRGRKRRALRRTGVSANAPAAKTQRPSEERVRDSTPQLRPAQLARAQLILQEINRKMCAVTWQPPSN